MPRSLLGGATPDAWLRQFGDIDFPAPDQITFETGTSVGARFHAEAHHDRVLGADFTYSATITADWTKEHLSAHLQFRISDEGRYGVRVGAGQVSFYRFALEDRPCAHDASVVAHCPLWPEGTDDPIEVPLGATGRFDPAVGTLRLAIIAEGSRFTVSFGPPMAPMERLHIDDSTLGVGRFGLYAIAATESLNVTFTGVAATTDPTLTSNFALLYNTTGYDRDGTKRALVRTLNDIDAADVDEATSTFSVINAAGDVKILARRFEAVDGVAGFRRTLGFQFLAADFSDLHEQGRYTIETRLTTSGGVRVLRSREFEIAPRVATERMLWPLGILNAKARRAADDGFRRGWFLESGSWSVGLDGAFVADRADDQGGSVLRRVFTSDNRPISEMDFRLTARITIVSGCDAQLQFRITPRERWAVTLQAGAAGGCAHGDGPGAVRLHHEGLDVPGDDHFRAVASHRMDDRPFELGRAYDIEVRALGTHIEVMLDGRRVIDFLDATNPRAGTFALKAWGSTVRFGHLKVWARRVGLSRPAPGVWIPFNRKTKLSAQGFAITTPDFENNDVAPEQDRDLMLPRAAQQHGFHDCNSFIGEVTSHGVFLSALMETWTTRAHAASDAQQEDLRRAIVTAVLYLNELHEQGNRTGAFAHQEPGRAAMNAKCDQILTTRFALYGLSSFAEKGGAVDRKLARQAFFRAVEAWNWLNDHGGRDLFLDSIATLRLARTAAREGERPEVWLERAERAVADVLALFAPLERMARHERSTLRSIPWFEGVYEAFARGPFTLTDKQRGQVASIVEQLKTLMNDPANGFCIVPQAQDVRERPEPLLPLRNWTNLADLPLAVSPIPVPAVDPPRHAVGDWHINLHFATAAADCVYVGRLANDRALERLATGNLSWMLGLNPGLPTTKIVARGAGTTDGPWNAASFVFNGPGAFARTIEGERVQTKNAKGWLAPWERPASSRHRESWAFDPADTGFQSIVNGYVLRENQWHYWSIGEPGWVCAETFLLIDAAFIRAALALEDWHGGALRRTTSAASTSSTRPTSTARVPPGASTTPTRRQRRRRGEWRPTSPRTRASAARG